MSPLSKRGPLEIQQRFSTTFIFICLFKAFLVVEESWNWNKNLLLFQLIAFLALLLVFSFLLQPVCLTTIWVEVLFSQLKVLSESEKENKKQKSHATLVVSPLSDCSLPSYVTSYTEKKKPSGPCFSSSPRRIYCPKFPPSFHLVRPLQGLL